MQLLKYIALATMLLISSQAAAQQKEETMNRIQLADKKYAELFAAERTVSPTDAEFMEILQRFIFGEVFYIGNLSDKERELITVVSLTTLQTLPQLKAHINAALNVGNSPLEIRESIYLAAPFIGFPRTLNAITVFNEVMREQGITLPLANSATITEESRYTTGLALQTALYGTEVKQGMKKLPAPYNDVVPDILTNFCFGDFYSRHGLKAAQRELLTLVILTAMGAEKQLKAHIIGNLKAGNNKETILAALVQTIPYIGLPDALTAINLVQEADMASYKPIYGE